jgi:hypothetical protein
MYHDFRAPCCLCASNPDCFGFTESAIYLSICGPYAGEYVTGCAADICGYLGKLACTWVGNNMSKFICIVDLERLYALRNLFVRQYPVRCKSNQEDSSERNAFIYITYSALGSQAAAAIPHMPIQTAMSALASNQPRGSRGKQNFSGRI